MMKLTSVICAVALAAPAVAQSVDLTPADPQPSADDLMPGLAVSYAYTGDVRTIADATEALRKSEPGPALRGLSYEDNEEEDPTLTATKWKKVAASITGFIRFETPGTYEVEFISNDGILASISGQEVGYLDGTHACEPTGLVEVNVPETGWYTIEATYFQRKGSACLMMDWSVEGDILPVPDEAFAHLK